MANNYQPIIGFEIHVELATKSKMFCGCAADFFGKEPNTHTCPVCLGLPGALPVPNKKAIEWTIMIGKALNCSINLNSKFDRKHYFYPDLPKGYQLSQYDQPFCFDGHVETSFGKVGITRVHLEEDTGKLQHTTLNGEQVSLVDFNRSGVPLVEIVTEPEIHSAEQAIEYARTLHQIVRFLGVSDADMEKGSMRLEANISLGMDLGYKVEVKNVNSFRYIEKAIRYELERQKKLLQSGKTPKQETRGFDENRGVTFSQRVKEEAADYRYFPEPDIPPIQFTESEIKAIQDAMAPLPDEFIKKFTDIYRIRPDYVEILTASLDIAQFAAKAFKEAQENNLKPADVANYIVNQKVDPITTNPQDIIETLVKEVQKPKADASQMEAWVAEVISENPDLVAKYRSGKTSVIGAFIGPVMKKSKGQADPQTVKELLQKQLA